jgi:sigma-B regulation protein RsbU (phosphoserine phosphatase)
MMLTPDATRGSPLKSYDRVTGAYEVLSPGDAVRELNRRFQFKDDRYFTMIYGLFDTQTSLLRVAQAGHPGPILIRKSGELQILGTGGMPIGVWHEIDFDSFETSVGQGDRLLLYSDGVTECVNAQNEAFGEHRLIAYLKERKAQPLDKLLGELLTEVRAWCGVMKFGDDVSLLAIEIT